MFHAIFRRLATVALFTLPASIVNSLGRMRARYVAAWVALSVMLPGSVSDGAGQEEPTLVIRPSSPNLVGPDPVTPAPVLIVANDRIELDDKPMTMKELGWTLRTGRIRQRLPRTTRRHHPAGGLPIAR